MNNNNTAAQGNNPFTNNNIKPADPPSISSNNTFAKPSDISTNAPGSILKNNVKFEDATKIETETKI